MSSTYRYSYVRHLRQGVTPSLMTVTAMREMTTTAYNAMVATSWKQTDEQLSILPKHHYAQTGFRNTYDAAKFCGDYAASQQNAYACAVCYTIEIPLDALAGTKAKIQKINATVYGDRWLSEGAVLAAIPSSSSEPPEWAQVLIANYSSPDPAVAIDSVSSWLPPLRKGQRSNTGPDNKCDAEIPLGGSGIDASRYLHVVLRLADYISVSQLVTADGTRDNAWIEGGALIDGSTISVTFDRAVSPDPNVISVIEPFSIFNSIPTNQGFWNNNSTINNQVQNSFDFLSAVPVKDDLVAGDFVSLALAAREGAGQFQGVGEFTTAQDVPQVFNGILPSPVVLPRVGFARVLTDLDGGQKIYRHFLYGGFFARGGFFSGFGQLLSGLSCENAIEAVAGSILVYRASAYAFEGTLPYAVYSPDGVTGLTCNCVSRISAFDNGLMYGSATSIMLGHTARRGDNLLASSMIRRDSEFTSAPSSVSVVPLGHIDFLGSSGISAGTVIPFSLPYQLRRHNVFFLNVSVIRVLPSGVSDFDQTVSFNPGKFILHKA